MSAIVYHAVPRRISSDTTSLSRIVRDVSADFEPPRSRAGAQAVVESLVRVVIDELATRHGVAIDNFPTFWMTDDDIVEHAALVAFDPSRPDCAVHFDVIHGEPMLQLMYEQGLYKSRTTDYLPSRGRMEPPESVMRDCGNDVRTEYAKIMRLREGRRIEASGLAAGF